MKFLSIPESFSVYRCPLTYAFDTEAEAHDVVAEVVNADTGEVIARKRLYDVTAGEINISPEVQRVVRQQLPEKVECCGEVDCSMQISVKVVIEGVESEVRTFIAALIDTQQPFQSLMTQIPRRTMACDEFDILSWFARPESAVEVVVECYGKGNESLSFTVEGCGQQAVAITALDFTNSPDSMCVTLKVDGEAVAVVDYEIKPNLRGARRLAWLNEHLAPELYTYPLRKSVLVKAARKAAEKIWGREAAALECDNELKLISAYEPQAQLRALADILAADRCWLVEGCVPQRVELVTDRVFTLPSGKMGMIEVDIRAAEEGVKLW